VKYKLNLINAETVAGLTGDASLYDEIALMRLTIQDLIIVMENQTQAQRLMIGTMLREAIEQLSRVMERAARLPPSPTAIPVAQVSMMLINLQSSIDDHLPEGPAKEHLITALKTTLTGISVREAPTAKVLRTCDMMDKSVPYLE
jgi:hypothetical protein